MQLGVLPHSGLLQKLPTIQTDRVADVSRPIPPPPPPQNTSRDGELRHARTLEGSLPSDPTKAVAGSSRAAHNFPQAGNSHLGTRLY